MADTPARLPIQRGLVAERKARLQHIKALNESPRRRHHVPGSDSGPDSESYDFRTPLGASTSTTVQSSPRRSTRSLLSTYVSNNNLSEILSRRASAVTIAGPYPSVKDRSARTYRREPTPFRTADNSSSNPDGTPTKHMGRVTDGSAVSSSQSKGQPTPPEISANVELHQPAPQNVRLKLADGLERGISDMSLGVSAVTMTPARTPGISRSPSDGDFARVVSQAMDDTSEGSNNEPLDLTLRPVDSQSTIRVSKDTMQGAAPDGVPESGPAGRKREYIRGLLKGRSHTAGDEDSMHTIDGGKSGIRRIFSSRSKRTASETSNIERGVMTTEYMGNNLVVRRCCNGHESAAVLSDKGVTVALLTITNEGWSIGSFNGKDKQRRCAVCDCSS